MRRRILLIEFGSTPTRHLARRLTEQGFSLAAELLNRGFDVSCVEDCELLVLDFDSADEDAPSTVRAIRAVRPNLPTIVLDRGDPAHAARVLNSGADDYMTKPYRFDELRARIEVLLRTAAPHLSDTLAGGDVRLDLDPRQVLTRLQLAARAWTCRELARTGWMHTSAVSDTSSAAT